MWEPEVSLVWSVVVGVVGVLVIVHGVFHIKRDRRGK